MGKSRSQVISSFTIIKGSLIEETYTAFRFWDFSISKSENLQKFKNDNAIGAKSANWLRDVAFVLSRRFDPNGRDRTLVELSKAECNLEIWKPLLLWHITRDEFLLRDFLLNWLFPNYLNGTYRIRGEDVQSYLNKIQKNGLTEKTWTYRTTKDVGLSLLRIAQDFGLLHGKLNRKFRPYHLLDESFLYILQAIAQFEPNTSKIIEMPDWRMYLMDSDDVERELFRLHQYKKLHYEVAGSLAQLKLPSTSLQEYVKELVA